MPNRRAFRVDHRPAHPFKEFDELLSALDEIADPDLREEVGDALADRALDTDWLREQVALEPGTLQRLTQAQHWGDEDLSVPQPLGSIVVATISGASTVGMPDYVAYVFARREGHRIAYSMADDAGGEVELIDGPEPLTLAEMIGLVDRVLVDNTPWPGDPTDILAGYFAEDRQFDLRVHSDAYPQLERWFAEAVREWLAAHREEE